MHTINNFLQYEEGMYIYVNRKRVAYNKCVKVATARQGEVKRTGQLENWTTDIFISFSDVDIRFSHFDVKKNLPNILLIFQFGERMYIYVTTGSASLTANATRQRQRDRGK